MSVTLTHSVNDIVRRLLVNMGHGTLPSVNGSWPIGVERPNSPDNCVTVRDTTGRVEGRLQPTGEVQEHFGIQVEVRSAVKNVGQLKAQEITYACDREIKNTTVTFESKTYNIINVNRVGTVMSIGRETPESMRELFTFNALVTIVQTN